MYTSTNASTKPGKKCELKQLVQDENPRIIEVVGSPLMAESMIVRTGIGAAIRTGAAKIIKEIKNGKACAKHPRGVPQ
jgi:hypothetical protein